MKSKTEITNEYISRIDNTQKKLEEYEQLIRKKREKVSELCYGNQKIEDIENELDEMIKTIGNMLDECSWTKQAISSNQYNF